MKKMIKGRIQLHHRIIAFLMVWTLLFTMMPYKKPSAEGLDMNGVGIYNNVFTGQTGVQACFKIELYNLVTTPDPPQEGVDPTYSYQPVTLTGEYQFTDSQGDIVYLNNGVLYLQQGRTVRLFDNNDSAFKRFLINNRAARVVITPVLVEGNEITQTKVFEEYNSGEDENASHSGSYTELDQSITNAPTGDPAKDEDILSTSKVYKIQYENNNNIITIKNETFTLKEFDLTPMVDVDFYVQWRDINSGRPDNDDVTFDLSRGEKTDPNTDPTQYTVYPPVDENNDPLFDLTRTITVQDSNNVIYSYSVPERSANNNPFVYKAEENLPEATGEISKYTIKTDDNVHFINFSLKDFSCNVNWLDTAHTDISNYGDIDKNIDFSFISDNFELIDETDPNNPRTVVFSYTEEEYNALTPEERNYVKIAYDYNSETGTYTLPYEYHAAEFTADEYSTFKSEKRLMLMPFVNR